MATKNTLEPDDLRIGWYYHDRSKDGATPAATLLRNEGDMISLSIPIAEGDAGGPVSRWFDGTGVRYGDDPDRTKYTYDPPNELLFTDPRGPIGLFHCRNLGKRSVMGGTAEGRIRVGFAVLGARSLEHRQPHRLRTYIPGMAKWIGLTSLQVKPEQDESGISTGLSLKTASLKPLELEPGLFLDTAWRSNYDRSDNHFEISDPPFIESVIEGGADFYDHLKKHQLFRDLVDLAYWKPTGYYRIQSSRDEDIEFKARKWREVKTYLVCPQEEGHSATALFYFGQIGVEGFQKWSEMRRKYDRAIGPLISLLGMKGSAVETQFIQSCVGLEGLGVQLARDGGVNKREILQKRLERVADDLGFSFSEDWARRTADRYNDIKHYDRDAVVDPLDAYYNLLENELVFRSWVALRLGLSPEYVLTHISTTPAGQSLVGQPGISFPEPAGEADDSEES